MAPRGPGTSGPAPTGRGLRVLVWCLAAGGLVVVAIFAALIVYLRSGTFTLREIDEPGDPDRTLIDVIPPPPVTVPVQPATSVGPDGELLRHPVWLSRPVPEYPVEALRRGVGEGVVRLRCETLSSGEFGACEVLEETPADAGFAAAALAATRGARVQPFSIDGFETESDVSFTVRFRPAPEP